MKPPVSLFVTGEPKPQPRPRAVIRGRHAGVYDPGTANDWKRTIANAWAAAGLAQSGPFTGPLRLSLSFHLPRPRHHYRTSGALKESAPAWHLAKPDTDNLCKAVMDELTRLAAWTDDSLVVTLIVRRRWADSQPGCNIHIREEEGTLL